MEKSLYFNTYPGGILSVLNIIGGKGAISNTNYYYHYHYHYYYYYYYYHYYHYYHHIILGIQPSYGSVAKWTDALGSVPFYQSQIQANISNIETQIIMQKSIPWFTQCNMKSIRLDNQSEPQCLRWLNEPQLCDALIMLKRKSTNNIIHEGKTATN